MKNNRFGYLIARLTDSGPNLHILEQFGFYMLYYKYA